MPTTRPQVTPRVTREEINQRMAAGSFVPADAKDTASLFAANTELRQIIEAQNAKLKELEELYAKMAADLQKQSPTKAKREFSKIEQLLKVFKDEIKQSKSYLPTVANYLGYDIENVMTARDVVDQVFDPCFDIYKKYDTMTFEQKAYALCGVALMIAGASIVVAALINPAVLPIVIAPSIGVSMINLGCYMAHQSIKQFNDPDSKLLHEKLVKLAGLLATLTKGVFMAPGRAIHHAYSSFKGDAESPVAAAEAIVGTDAEFVDENDDDPNVDKPRPSRP